MGELADDFRFMKEQAKKHREKVEPSRFDYVEKRLKQAGCKITGYTYCEIYFQKGKIAGKIYPYKGWWSAKSIGSDRGIQNLIKKLEKVKEITNERQ